jgi:molybdopterin synthase sulfur carrier subunit
MKASVLLFARLREDLGTDALTVELAVDSTVIDLIDVLEQKQGARWKETLTAENIKIAINQELVIGMPTLNDGDEVAFFPPVTGG